MRPNSAGNTIPPDGGWGWVIVFTAGIATGIPAGYLRSITLFYHELLETFGESATSTATVMTVDTIVGAFTSPLAGALCNQFGCRPMAIVGAAIIASAFLIGAFLPSLFYFYFTYSILRGFGATIFAVSKNSVINLYFDKNKGKANALSAMFYSLGSVYMAPLVQALFREYGFQGALVIISGLMLHLIPAAALFRPLKVLDTETLAKIADQMPNSNDINKGGDQNTSDIEHNNVGEGVQSGELGGEKEYLDNTDIVRYNKARQAIDNIDSGYGEEGQILEEVDNDDDREVDVCVKEDVSLAPLSSNCSSNGKMETTIMINETEEALPQRSIDTEQQVELESKQTGHKMQGQPENEANSTEILQNKDIGGTDISAVSCKEGIPSQVIIRTEEDHPRQGNASTPDDLFQDTQRESQILKSYESDRCKDNDNANKSEIKIPTNGPSSHLICMQEDDAFKHHNSMESHQGYAENQILESEIQSTMNQSSRNISNRDLKSPKLLRTTPALSCVKSAVRFFTGEVLRRSEFRLFSLFMCSYAFIHATTGTFLSGLALEKGCTIDQCAIAMSITSVIEIPLRLSYGFLFDVPSLRFRRPLVFGVCGCMLSIGVAVLPLYPGNLTVLVMWAVTQAIAGIIVSQWSTVMSDILPRIQLTSGFGILRLFMGIGALLAPVSGGAIRDVSGAYSIVYHVAGAQFFICSIIFLVYDLRKRCQHNETVAVQEENT